MSKRKQQTKKAMKALQGGLPSPHTTMWVAGIDYNGEARVVEVQVKISDKTHIVKADDNHAAPLLGHLKQFRVAESPLCDFRYTAIQHAAGVLQAEKAKLLRQINAVDLKLNKLQDLADKT